MGRKAGSLEDYRYSAAMKRSGVTWTPATLDTFIADPQGFIKGNRMAFAGITDPADRSHGYHSSIVAKSQLLHTRSDINRRTAIEPGHSHDDEFTRLERACNPVRPAGTLRVRPALGSGAPRALLAEP
jgi:hypothetical protein